MVLRILSGPAAEASPASLPQALGLLTGARSRIAESIERLRSLAHLFSDASDGIAPIQGVTPGTAWVLADEISFEVEHLGRADRQLLAAALVLR